MPSPSDSSSVASASGSRGWSDSRRGMSGRGPGGARLLLYLGLCHLGLGAMVLAFSFTSMAFTSSPRVRQSCPFWAGFFVVASGVVGIISWRRPLTLVVSLFMLLSAVCVILSLAGSMLSCQNAQMVKSMLDCKLENGLCVCCAPTRPCSITEEETLVLYLNANCSSVRHQLKDLLFSACGLSILSTIICTLSTVTCSIHIFSLDLVHLLAPHRSRSVNPECTTPQDAFLTNIMDFEEFVPPIPPPPYYPPEYTCSSETDAQRFGLRIQGDRGNKSKSVEGGEGGDSGEYISYRGPPSQTPESPLAGGPRARRFLRGERSNSCSSPSTATNTYRSPILRRQAMLASSCSQLEAIGGSTSQQRSSIPELRIHPSTPLRQGAAPASSVPPTSAAGEQCGGQVNGQLFAGQPLYLRRRAGKGEKDGEGVRRDSEGLLRLVRSHSEPGLGSSTDTGKSDTKIGTCLTIQYITCSCMSSSLVDFGSVGSKASIDTGPSSEACLLPRTSLPPAAALPRKGSMKSTATGVQLPSKPPPTSPLRLPKDCHRSLGDLKVTRGLVARFLQRSKRNLSPSSEYAGSTVQGPKRRGAAEGAATNHLPLEQVLLTPWNTSRGHPNYHSHQPHRRGHHHSHSDSRHNRHQGSRVPEGIHLQSCGDLSSSSASLRRLLTPHPPHGSSGALYSESAL
ncbi:hypothetical protein GBF38_014187 [Nibea albiflora]|uniref:Uncharacterized protein n=1 Tax=Nibea albiflora TaxID=240163 RepID=A0ACB7F7B5_NIBAL|nr:hypothetical protein GBF38_014187 [Nibea albiflora]